MGGCLESNSLLPHRRIIAIQGETLPPDAVGKIHIWKDPHLLQGQPEKKSTSPKEIEQGCSHQAITSPSTAPKCHVHLLAPQPTVEPADLARPGYIYPRALTRCSRLTLQGPLFCAVSEAVEDINGRSLPFCLGRDIDVSGSLA